MKLILTISILLNVILIYNLGDYKMKIKDLKRINRVNQNIIDKWIEKEKTYES